MENPTTKMYRYRDSLGTEAVHLVLDSFKVVKETDCYCWIAKSSWVPKCPKEFDRYIEMGLIKKVRKGADRSFCHVDKLSALRAYHQRKKSQARHLEQQLARNEQALAFLDKKPLEELVVEAEHGANLGRHAIHDKYNWIEW